jgi:hypothetical protein
MEDMSKKGRAHQPKGELHGGAKLTEREVVEIRAMYRPGVVSMGKISTLFGVSRKLIHNIVNRKAWNHIA